MSLISALNIGKTALAAHQAAIQVTTNNIANAGNPEFTRQVAKLEPTADRVYKPGSMIGTGVNVASITRQIDEALEERIRNSVSDGEAATAKQQWLSRVESVFNALGDNDLSSQLSEFFNGWSNLANKPQDTGSRQVIVQNGEQIVNSLKSMRSQLLQLGEDVDQRLDALAGQANQMVDQIAQLNVSISTAEAGAGQGANGLRDQRDSILKQLAQLVDIKVQDTGNGMVNVMVGSEPIVIQNISRGLQLGTEDVDGTLRTTITTITDAATLDVNSGQMGALLSLAGESSAVVDQIDALAGNLIFEMNKLHSSGQGTQGLSSVTATNNVTDLDEALNSDAAGLTFLPQNGSFVVQVRQKATGQTTSTLVKVDLDGLNGDDTTLQSLVDQLNGIAGVSATTGSGRMKLSSASSDYEFTFSQDSSGVLAALGINGFFTGTDASNIAVASDLKSNLGLLAAARNGEPGDNSNALAIARLETQSLAGLNGMSLRDGYQTMVNTVAVSSKTAQTNQQAAQAVRDTLETQRESLSGVSLDEEAINLMREQRAFQAAARVITAVDEMMRTLLQMV